MLIFYLLFFHTNRLRYEKNKLKWSETSNKFEIFLILISLFSRRAEFEVGKKKAKKVVGKHWNSLSLSCCCLKKVKKTCTSQSALCSLHDAETCCRHFFTVLYFFYSNDERKSFIVTSFFLSFFFFVSWHFIYFMILIGDQTCFKTFSCVSFHFTLNWNFLSNTKKKLL